MRNEAARGNHENDPIPNLLHTATHRLRKSRLQLLSSAAALAPNLKCIAPWWDAEFRKEFRGRAEMIAYAEANQIPIKASMKKPYSMDRNLLHISSEARAMEDP